MYDKNAPPRNVKNGLLKRLKLLKLSHALVIVGNTPIIMCSAANLNMFGIYQIFGEIFKTLGEPWSWSSWCDGAIIP